MSKSHALEITGSVTQTSEEDLLPCPFCGSRDLIIRTYPTHGDGVGYTTMIVRNGGRADWSKCCGSQSITLAGDSQVEALAAGIAAWNTRHIAEVA